MATEFCEVRDGNNRREDDQRRSTSGTDEKSCMTVAERLRQYRERQEMIQRRGIETLREMDARAEEFRRKQEDAKRRALREARTREEEQRAIVEERRRRLLEEEHERRLMKLQKLWESNRKTDEARRRHRKKRAGRSSFGSGAMSDGTLSSGGRTPTRPYRPHSIAGQVPNYALPTVASQIRSARWTTDSDVDGQVVTVCYRCNVAVPAWDVPGSVSPAVRKRSRSAEPAPRSNQHSSKHSSVSEQHPLAGDSWAFASRTLPGRATRSARLSSVPAQFISIPFNSKPGTRLTQAVSGTKQEADVTSHVGDEDKQIKRKSFLAKLKCQPRGRTQEPSTEFRLLSFRHQDGTASLTVARGLKTSTKSKVQAFQKSKKMKPFQNDISRTKSNEEDAGKYPSESQQQQHRTTSRPPLPQAKVVTPRPKKKKVPTATLR